MRAKVTLLAVLSLMLIGASVVLFAFRQDARSHRVLSCDEVEEMPAVRDVYRSINNWETVEETEFTGVPLYLVLEEMGVQDGSAEVKLMAPDGYFWPAVGTVLTLEDLRNPNEKGLYSIVAYDMNGEALSPEPDGTGPMRLVMPQYREDEINKPSWVSNLRLIEVGPLEEGFEAPDALEVPVDEVWVYGDIAPSYRYPLVLPLLLVAAGLLLLAATALYAIKNRDRSGAVPPAAAVLLLAAVLVGAGLWTVPSGPSTCLANPGARTFSLSELKSMPSFSGHFTFLKSQPPYTYYEADYKGVPLEYLLEEEMNLLSGASEVVVRARDNYNKSLSLSQVRATYPGNLKVIIAYEKNGSPLSGDESGLRLIVPQTVPGDIDQGGEPNTPMCVRMVYAVEVLPVPQGERPVDASSVPVGSLAVYGSVTEPPPPPTPAPAPEPPAPEQEPADISPTRPGQEEAPQPGQEQPGAVEAGLEEQLASISGDPDLVPLWLNCSVLYAVVQNPFTGALPLNLLVNKAGGGE